jgi:hypothetical protein
MVGPVEHIPAESDGPDGWNVADPALEGRPVDHPTNETLDAPASSMSHCRLHHHGR